jgi:iron complex outermembrane recepter protein
MKKILLYILTTLSFFESRAIISEDDNTKTSKITGQTLDNTGSPLLYANVALLKAKDSTLVKGTLTDEKGNFSFGNITHGEYLLCATQMGYQKTYSQPFTVNESTTQQQIIKLAEESQLLKEITVVGQKPFIEQQLDKMVININNSISAAGNNALEVLEKVPGVMIDHENRINIQGRAGVLVMVDGRPSHLSKNDLGNFLKSFSASEIDKIELITNPSAKYDAAGNAGIINIILKKNVKHGLNGTLSGFYRQGVYGRSGLNGNLNWRQKKYGVYAGYAFSDRNALSEFSIDRNFNQTSAQGQFLRQFLSTQSPYSSHSGRVVFDLYLSPKSTIGITGFTLLTQGSVLGNNTTTNTQQSSGIQTGRSLTESAINEQIDNYSLNLYWKQTFTKKDQELTLQYDRNAYTQSSQQQFGTQYFDAQNKPSNVDGLAADLPASAHIQSLRLDYTMPLGEEKTSLETGLKWSDVNTTNNMVFFTDESKTQIDSRRTNNFEYKERIAAAYVSIKKSFGKKWTIQTGLRLEQTNGQGHQLLPKDSVFKRTYLNLFPTVYIQRKISEKSLFKLTYTRRIDRPSYQDLNPFRYYVDPYTFKEGNPFLRPQFSNNFEFSHVYEGAMTHTLSYNETNDVISPVIKQDNTSLTTFQTNENLARQRTYGFTSILPIPVKKWWMSINYVNIAHRQFDSQFLGSPFSLSQTTFLINSTNNITLPKEWSAEVSAFYQSKSFFGLLTLEPIWAASLGIQKTLWDKKASIKLNVSDLFWTRIVNMSLEHANVDTRVSNRTDSRTISLSLSYKLGSRSVQAISSRRSGSDEEKKRIKIGEEK